MAEAMAVESIIEAFWQMKGFWTKLRFPFKTKNGQWSDVDVLAYDPKNKILVISESKVQGSKRIVYAYTNYTREKYGNIFKYDGDTYLSFLKHIKVMCTNGVIFENFSEMVKHLIIQLVSNYYVTDTVLPLVKQDILKKVNKYVPNEINIEISLDSTFAILFEILKLEKKKTQGKRYGHPIIDIVREINRYLTPSMSYAGNEKEALKKALKKTWLEYAKE